MRRRSPLGAGPLPHARLLHVQADAPLDELARKVLIKHLQSGNSYGIQLKREHCKFPQPFLGSWVNGSETVGTDWKPPVLEGWEPPLH